MNLVKDLSLIEYTKIALRSCKMGSESKASPTTERIYVEAASRNQSVHFLRSSATSTVPEGPRPPSPPLILLL